jgi:biotin synthase-related radical SAM superfamily protein
LYVRKIKGEEYISATAYYNKEVSLTCNACGQSIKKKTKLLNDKENIPVDRNNVPFPIPGNKIFQDLKTPSKQFKPFK